MTFFLPIVIDDFLSFESMTIIGECITVARKNVQPGYVRTDLDRPVLHLPRKKNKVHYIESEQISPVLVEIKKKIKATFKEHNLKLPSMFELGTPQLSFYAPGDYYAQHKDKTELGITFLLFPSKKTFSGGKIKFHECNGISTNYKKNSELIITRHPAGTRGCNNPHEGMWSMLATWGLLWRNGRTCQCATVKLLLKLSLMAAFD